MNRFYKIVVALAVVTLLFSFGSKAEGVLLPEPSNARQETFIKYVSLIKNYTYVSDPEGTDTWSLYDGTKPFKGDCEDFAFTMQYQVGAGSVYGVYRYGTGLVDHAVFVYAGMVWELDGLAYTLNAYHRDVGVVMYAVGDYTPELR
jgi:hypothetical protein